MDELSRELLAVMKNIKKRFSAASPVFEISKGEFFALQEILQHEKKEKEKGNREYHGMTVSECSRRMELSKPAASQLLRILENKGFILRSTTENDRRIVYIRLSERGRKSVEYASCAWQQFVEEVFNRLGENNTRNFISICRRLDEIMEELIEKQNFLGNLRKTEPERKDAGV